jgi:hypothetical protein
MSVSLKECPPSCANAGASAFVPRKGNHGFADQVFLQAEGEPH